MDPNKRMTYMHQAEDMLMKDIPMISLYFYTNVVEVKTYVKDLYKSPLGFVYLQNTYIDKSGK